MQWLCGGLTLGPKEQWASSQDPVQDSGKTLRAVIPEDLHRGASRPSKCGGDPDGRIELRPRPAIPPFDCDSRIARQQVHSPYAIEVSRG